MRQAGRLPVVLLLDEVPSLAAKQSRHASTREPSRQSSFSRSLGRLVPGWAQVAVMGVMISQSGQWEVLKAPQSRLNHAWGVEAQTPKNRVRGFEAGAPASKSENPFSSLESATGYGIRVQEIASGQAIYCNGDPVNRFDADGRCAEGLQSGLNGSISPNAPTSPAFYAANLVGGYLSGAGSGVQNGAGGDVNALSLGNVQGAFGSDSSSSEYAMGRNITYGGMATVAVVGTGGVAGGAALGAMEGSVATGAMTEAGFVSAVPASGTGAANILSLAARQIGSGLVNNANVMAPGGIVAATYALSNSEKVQGALEFTLSASDLTPTGPYSSIYDGAGDLANRFIVTPLKDSFSK